jgi:hypothetical protein
MIKGNVQIAFVSGNNSLIPTTIKIRGQCTPGIPSNTIRSIDGALS